MSGVTGRFSLGVENGIRQRLTEFSHSKHPLPTTQEVTLHIDITRYLVKICAAEDGEALYSE